MKLTERFRIRIFDMKNPVLQLPEEVNSEYKAAALISRKAAELSVAVREAELAEARRRVVIAYWTVFVWTMCCVAIVYLYWKTRRS